MVVRLRYGKALEHTKHCHGAVHCLVVAGGVLAWFECMCSSYSCCCRTLSLGATSPPI